jgi:DNA-binding NtrC family response regulator
MTNENEPVSSSASQPRRILVVDDENDIRALNAGTLTRSGYKVDAAENGAVAWEALQVTSYALVITDNSMPKVTGVDLIKKLHAARMAVPVILATHTWPAHEFERFPELQPTAALMKPYTEEELLATVKRVLGAVEFTHERITSTPEGPNPINS